MSWRLLVGRAAPWFGHRSYSTTSEEPPLSNFNSYRDISFPLDDPLIYILTTSEKPDGPTPRFPNDLLTIPGGAYACFNKVTLIDSGHSGSRDIGRDEFRAMYEDGEIAYKGQLTIAHIDELLGKIAACPRVARRVKQILNPHA